MNKTVLILKHEFRQTIKRKGFVIMTLAFPLIVLLIIGIYQIVRSIDTPPALDEEVAIGYIDEVGGFDDYINQSGGITFVAYQTEEEATGALLAEDISEYFIIPLDYVSEGVITRYTLEKEVEPPDEIWWAMKSFLVSNLLEGQTSLEIAERVKAPLGLYSIRLDETGDVATEQGGFGALIVPSLFGFLLIIAIFGSSSYLLQGLGEEKENRIIEILLSSVSTRQLLTGKVLGLGAAGLVQMVIWLLSAVFLLRLASATIGGVLSTLQISGNLLFLGIVYFFLGYLLFAVLMAGIGAIGATARESGQMSMLILMPVWIPAWLSFLFIENPDHIVNKILTMIPITAPMAVFMRLGTSGIPTWELVLSISLMLAAIIGALVLASKAFRTFLLMYGKTPRLGEIIRSLRRA